MASSFHSPLYFPYKYLLPCHPFFHTTVHRHLRLRGREGKHPHSQSRALLPAAVTRRDSRGSDRASSYVMSRGSKGGRGGALDLKLHLSPPSPSRGTERAASSSDEEWSSSPSSCLSSEGERESQLQSHGLQWSDSPEATSMVLAACPRCLMYVMLSEADPRCPRCRSPVLLDFLHHAARNVVSGGGRREGDDHHGRGGGGRNRTG